MLEEEEALNFPTKIAMERNIHGEFGNKFKATIDPKTQGTEKEE